MSTRKRRALLQSIANTIADYRQDDLDPPTPDHVDRWIGQFDTDVQEEMLAELDHVLKEAYIPKSTVEKFLSGLAKTHKLVGDDPRGFWKNVGFLDIQQGGSSQHEMLEMFDQVLQDEDGLTIADCSATSGEFIYIDDVVFSGLRV